MTREYPEYPCYFADAPLAIAPGQKGATPYHHAVAKLLTALFDTQLGNERIEVPIHNGIKRLDITYDNVAAIGFFDWLRRNYPAALIVAECKNYGKDIANPEFDQLAMRFSPKRGQVGLLVSRKLKSPKRAAKRARAAATDDHGYIVYLTDADLEQLVTDAEAASSASNRYAFPVLRKKFDALIGA